MADNERHEIEPLWFTFDGPPGPVAGRFVELENERGQSRSAGKWADNGGGYWTCGPFVTVDDHKKAVARALASAREEGRRAGMEEACRAACARCGSGNAPHDFVQGIGAACLSCQHCHRGSAVHVAPGGVVRYCDASDIRALIGGNE